VAPIGGAIYAEFPFRAIAFLVDLLLANFGATLLASVVLPILLIVLPDDPFGSNLVAAGARVLAYVVVTLTAVYFWRTFRASPGQMVFGLFVLERGIGTGLPAGSAFVRWIVLWAPGVISQGAPFIVNALLARAGDNPPDVQLMQAMLTVIPAAWYAILALTVLADRRRGRGLHDLAAGSVVIRRVSR
jgi:uncharacterized RDD family membrane protein YckC